MLPRIILVCFVSVYFLLGCTSAPNSATNAPSPAATPAKNVKDKGPGLAEAGLPTAAGVDPADITMEASIPPQTPASLDPRNTTAKIEYKVSPEVREKTFNEVKALIDYLNNLIRKKDFSSWLTYLSAEYKDYFSRPEVLAQQSESRVLQAKGIQLKTLEDYFLSVVVPSRANLKLDDLFFLNENEVEAIMQVGSRRVTVYRLVKTDNVWKISLSGY